MPSFHLQNSFHFNLNFFTGLYGKRRCEKMPKLCSSKRTNNKMCLGRGENEKNLKISLKAMIFENFIFFLNLAVLRTVLDLHV